MGSCAIARDMFQNFPFPISPTVPVHTGLCSVVVEGSRRAHAALFTLLPTMLRDGEGGATALAGRHTGTILHGGRTGECYCGKEREKNMAKEREKNMASKRENRTKCGFSENSPQSGTCDRKSTTTENRRQWRA